MRKSLWSPDEDEKLRQYVAKHGCGNWSDVAKHTGLHRCGKSCRLRWINYLRPDLKRGPFTAHEVRLVVHLHNNLGNSWSKIATHLPGRTDNDVKNFWHSYTRSRRLQQQQQLDNSPSTDKDAGGTTKGVREGHSDAHIVCAAVSNDGTTSQEPYRKHGHHDEFQLSAFRVPSNVNREMYIGGYNIVGSEHELLRDTIPSFFFDTNALQHYPSSSAADIILANRDSSTHTSYFMEPTSVNVIRPALLQGDKPSLITMPNPLCVDSEYTIALPPKPAHPQLLPRKSSITNLGSQTAPFDQPTSSREGPCSALSRIKATTEAEQDWSHIYHPSSIQMYNLINSSVVANSFTPTSGSHQVQLGTGSIVTPPEGLQSVVWNFFNQQEACMTGLSSCPADRDRTHDDHIASHFENPSSDAATGSLVRRPETEIQHSMAQLGAFDQYLNVKDAASYSSTSIQHLLQDVQANFLDEYCNPNGTALCSSS